MKRPVLAVVCAVLLSGVWCGTVTADPIAVEALALQWGADLPYTEAPGQTVEYTKTAGGRKWGDGHVTLMKREAAPPVVNPISGNLEITSFFDVFSDITLDTGVIVTLSGSGTVLFTETNPASNTLEAEILSFELTTSTDPLLMVRESPSRPSYGAVTVLPALGLPGSPPQYHIDSFFDIFTELSDDGGLNWYPVDILPGESDVLPLRVEASGVVPEPATLAVLALTATALIGRTRRMA